MSTITRPPATTALRARAARRALLARFSPLLLVIGLLLLWEIGVRVGGVPGYLLPPPSAIAGRMIKDYRLLALHTWAV